MSEERREKMLQEAMVDEFVERYPNLTDEHTLEALSKLESYYLLDKIFATYRKKGIETYHPFNMGRIEDIHNNELFDDCIRSVFHKQRLSEYKSILSEEDFKMYKEDQNIKLYHNKLWKFWDMCPRDVTHKGWILGKEKNGKIRRARTKKELTKMIKEENVIDEFGFAIEGDSENRYVGVQLLYKINGIHLSEYYRIKSGYNKKKNITCIILKDKYIITDFKSLPDNFYLLIMEPQFIQTGD